MKPSWSFSSTSDLSSSKASQGKETSSRWGVQSLSLGQAEERQPIADAKGLLQEARETRSVVAKFTIRGRRRQEPAIVGSVDLTHLQLFTSAVDEDGRPVRLTPGAAAAGFPAAADQFSQASPEKGLVVAEGVDGGGKLGQEPVQLQAVEARIVGSSIHDLRKGIAGSIS